MELNEKKLSVLRKEKGFTQVELAIKAGVSLTSYRLWEAGVTNPTQENLEKLKKVLGVVE